MYLHMGALEGTTTHTACRVRARTRACAVRAPTTHCHCPPPPPRADCTQMLDRDLEEAEEQYGLAVRSHMMVVDNLLDLQYQRMRALETEFNGDLRSLEDEFDT